MLELDKQRTFEVSGMTCAHCKTAIERAIRLVPGVSSVCVDLAAGKAVVMGSFDQQRIVEAIVDAGYESLKPKNDLDGGLVE